MSFTARDTAALDTANPRNPSVSVYSAHDTPKLPTPTFTQAFLAHLSKLRQIAVLATTRLYVPEIHFSAVTILPYDMFSNMEHVKWQKKPAKKSSIGIQ
jgi:hypothetical protein